ncbi:WD40 repeat-like protein [Rhizopogon vinicolor AM-OR11-026]|uniref:WD40 repeat-like protein n=1 Tax=Rhizopogon vinicolor AM-OR11-026 TaxID=1314800 RepID=A0A1B7MJK0_9AGAM|nr:WD40 repeat-like protein [Rhizopogon vinicolor AM-OR11-026]
MLTVQREVISDSHTLRAPLTSEEDPPPYGAQHRLHALWEGGNETLPPLWQEFKVLDDKTRYVDNTLYMGSWNRPLPGVRLDQHGDLVPGCEWHISPLGRSYFANHNNRTTSWKKPKLERPAGSLTPHRIIEGHSGCIWDLASLSADCHIMSTSIDGSIRQWTRDGEPIGKPWDSNGEAVGLMAVSPDQTMVVNGNADYRIRLWNIKEGSMVGNPWEGHIAVVRCLDWSPNGLEIVSGSEDGTVRRWNPDTGRQIVPTIETGHSWVFAVKYSPQNDKFVSGGMDKIIRVWSKDGEMLMEIKGHCESVKSLCWSNDNAHIFSGSGSPDCTIRKWRLIDGMELVVLRGHTSIVTSLCLCPNACHLVSASRDCSIRIWDLKTNQSVGNPLLHDDELCALAMSADGKYIATAGSDAKIYLWSFDVALGGDRAASVHGGSAEDEQLKASHICFPSHCTVSLLY